MSDPSSPLSSGPSSRPSAYRSGAREIVLRRIRYLTRELAEARALLEVVDSLEPDGDAEGAMWRLLIGFDVLGSEGCWGTGIPQSEESRAEQAEKNARVRELLDRTSVTSRHPLRDEGGSPRG